MTTIMSHCHVVKECAWQEAKRGNPGAQGEKMARTLRREREEGACFCASGKRRPGSPQPGAGRPTMRGVS